MTAQQKCTELGERQRNIRAVFRDTLSLFVGPGRRFQVEDVAAAIERGPDTVRRYLRGESCPEWDSGVLLLGALPPEFGTAVLRPAGLTGFRRIDGATSSGEALRDVTQAAATLATALADGRIDHTELPVIRQDLTEAMVAIAQFLARGEIMGGEGR